MLVFGRTAQLRDTALQLQSLYRLANPDRVALLVPPYAPGLELATEYVLKSSSGRPLVDAVNSLSDGSGSLAALFVAAAIIFAMAFIAARLLRLSQPVSHVFAWSLSLVLIGGAPFPPFGYFSLSPDLWAATGAAAGILSIGFLYRFGFARWDRQAGFYAAGLLGTAMISAALTPLGAAYAAMLLAGGIGLVLTAESRPVAARMSGAIAVVIILLVLMFRAGEPGIRDFNLVRVSDERAFSGVLSLLLGGTSGSAKAFAMLLFSAIFGGAVCFAWGNPKQRAIGGIAAFVVVPLAAILFLLGLRFPQLKTIDYRTFDAYVWPFLLLALILAVEIVATALAGLWGGRPTWKFSRSIAFVVLLGVALFALVAARHRIGLDRVEAFWLTAANAQAGSRPGGEAQASFPGYTFALSPAAAENGDDVVFYSAPGFRSSSTLGANARIENTRLDAAALTMANFARRAGNATDGKQLNGLLANWGVANVVVSKPSAAPGDVPSQETVGLPAPNLSGFSPMKASVIAEPSKALAWFSENGFGRRDWVVSNAAIPEQLSPARNMRFTQMGNNLRAQAEADGPSLVVLPIGYDPCRMKFAAAGSSGADDRARLVLINLSQTGIFFQGKLDANVQFSSRRSLSSTCAEQQAGVRSRAIAGSEKPVQPLVDLPLPAALAVSVQLTDGGLAAIKIAKFSVYDVASPEVPLPKHPDQLPAYAIDGDTATFFSTAMMAKPSPIYLQFDFDAVATVDRVAILARQGYPTLVVVPDLIETSIDGQTWQAATMKASKSGHFVDIEIKSVAARHLRIRTSQGPYAGNFYDQIAEVSAFSKDLTSKTISMSWRGPLGAIAGSKVTDYRVRWSTQPAPGVDCTNCRITAIPMPNAKRFGDVETAVISTGMMPKEARYVSLVGIDMNGKVLAVSNPVPLP